MPLIKSASQDALSQNISQLIKDGYPQKQAVAIALRVQSSAKKKNENIGYISLERLMEVAWRGFDASRPWVTISHGVGTSPSASTMERPEDKRKFDTVKLSPTSEGKSGSGSMRKLKKPTKRKKRR